MRSSLGQRNRPAIAQRASSADPAYIVDLIKRVARVSVDTMEIVRELPALEKCRMKCRRSDTCHV
jgi:hypothetical protein